MRKSRLLGLAVTGTLVGSVVTAVPVRAASIIECQPVFGAPSLNAIENDPSRNARTYYYHSCNVDPGANGVVTMYEVTGLIRESGQGNQYVRESDRPQQSVAFNKDWVVPEGIYRPFAALYLSGTFTYGSVGGCGRLFSGSNTVRCEWLGIAKYVPKAPYEAFLLQDLPFIPGIPVP